MLAIRTILHPTDFSEHSDAAFQLACSLARDYNSRLIILHVTEPPVAIAGEGMFLPSPGVDIEPLEKRLHQMRPADPKVTVDYQLLEGNAVTEILRVAEETKCDMIVLGTHGRTGLGRVFMGSIAEQIVRRAECSVVTLKSPKKK